MPEEDYTEGDLVITEDYKGKHFMNVKRVTLHGLVHCHCFTCGVGYSFGADEIRHATKVEKTEYRLLGAV